MIANTELPPITSTVFGLLALRQFRIDRIEFNYAKLPIRITPQVELYLTCYRLHRQREIEALSPLDWMRHTLITARLEVASLSAAAFRSDDLATVAATLARVELLSGYMQFLTEKLEEIAFAGAGAEGVSPEEVADAGL